ncbi:MAG: hypothetical protein JW902_06495 [Syntrophaceae bacterium]|nr:hypothetical protein [Syntrophaceae bacterium]
MNQALSAFEKSPEGFLTPGSYDKKQAEYFIQSDIGQFPNFLGHVGRIPKAQSKLSNMTGIPLVSSTQSTTHFREPDKSAGASQLRAVSSNASSSSDLRNSKLSTAATPSSSKTARFDPSKYVGEGPYEEQLAKALHESSLQNPSTPSENPFSVPHSQQNSVGSNDADRKGKRPVQY